MNGTYFIIYIVCFVVISLAVVGASMDWFRQERKIKRLQTEVDHFKHSKYLREYGYDQDECEDLHLAGDCPLCGAK